MRDQDGLSGLLADKLVEDGVVDSIFHMSVQRLLKK